jgi:2-polyprenyl-6-hydroxyphenyl methylase/3-demethylubiquinone-9 3-methyltransferase
MSSKVDSVKALFEAPEKYLAPFQAEMRLREQAVQHFTGALQFDRILDVGCGNGAISVPLLPQCRNLTLLDLSSAMLNLARRKVPSERMQDVEFVNANFEEADLGEHRFDLILCLGVLAHVSSPAAVIAKLSRLAAPGAIIVLEFTDSYHFWSAPVVLYHALLNLLRPAPYALNLIREKQVAQWCRQAGLYRAGLYRYARPPLGCAWIFSQERIYRMTLGLFGVPGRNRKLWMGNEYICLLGSGDAKQAAGCTAVRTGPRT